MNFCNVKYDAVEICIKPFTNMDVSAIVTAKRRFNIEILSRTAEKLFKKLGAVADLFFGGVGDILPTYRGGGFSLKYGNPYSINELTPCVPRFFFGFTLILF